jgi:hypothetical protein
MAASPRASLWPFAVAAAEPGRWNAGRSLATKAAENPFVVGRSL